MPANKQKRQGARQKDVLRGYHCPHCRTSQEFRALHIRGVKDVLMVLLLRYPIRCIRCLKMFYGPRWLLPHIKKPEKGG